MPRPLSEDSNSRKGERVEEKILIAIRKSYSDFTDCNFAIFFLVKFKDIEISIQWINLAHTVCIRSPHGMLSCHLVALARPPSVCERAV